MENCGNERFYRIMEKKDADQFNDVFAGVRNISTKPRSGYETLRVSLWVEFGAKDVYPVP